MLWKLWMQLDPAIQQGVVITLSSAIGLDVFGRLVRAALFRLFPDRIAASTQGLSKMELKYFRRDFRLYVGATLHAVVVFLVASYSFYLWYAESRSREVNAQKTFAEWLCSPQLRDLTPEDTRSRHAALMLRDHPVVYIMLGYILQDTLGLRGRLLRQKATLLHHVSTGVLCVLFSTRFDELTQFIPVITGIEGSTIFLDLAWLVKRLGCDRLHHWCNLAFAASFFVLRVLFFPGFNLWLHVVDPGLIIQKHTIGIYILTVLQFYWFRLIYKKVMGSGSRPSPPATTQ